MATREIDLLNMLTNVDPTGDVYVAPIASILTLTNAPGGSNCIVMPAAATISADSGIEGAFRVPQEYVAGSETVVVDGILEGAPSTLFIAFGIQFKEYADDDAFDVALGTQRIASDNSHTQSAVDYYKETIDVSAESWTVGRWVHYFFFIDDSVHTYTSRFLLTGLTLQIQDA